MTSPVAVVQPPRVLVVHPSLAPYRIDLFNQLSAVFPFRVLFLRRLPGYDANLNAAHLESKMRCDHAVVAADRDAGPATIASHMIAEMRRFRPDVVVTHEFRHASGVAAAWSAIHGGQPRHIVWTTKNEREVTSASGARRLGMRWLSRASAAVLTYSASAADRLAELSGARRDKFFVCANHQDPARLRGAAQEALPAVLAECQARGLAGRTLVLVVSRLVGEKNVGIVVEAFGRAFAADPDVSLVILGEGPLRPALEAAADRSRTVFLGQRGPEEVQAWMAVASLTVLASIHEPYGAVVGESLAQGTPVLCSDAAGAASLIDDGAKGAVFAPQRVDALVNLLRRFRPTFIAAAEAARLPKPRLPGPGVADDLAGFRAAVRHATARGTACASAG